MKKWGKFLLVILFNSILSSIFFFPIVLYDLPSEDLNILSTVTPSSNNYPSNLYNAEQNHFETIVEYSHTSNLYVGFFTKGSVIKVNYTVLPESNGSVSLEYLYTTRNYTVWSPMSENLILAPGESFSGEFTLITAITSGLAQFGFDGRIEVGGTNATVHYWSEILVTGKTPAAGFFVLSGSIILLLGLMIHSKRKQQVKRWRK